MAILRKLFFTIILLTLSMCIQCDGNEEAEMIANFVDDVMEEHEVPGMIVAIVKDNQPFLVRGFGVSNIEDGTPVTEDTIMHVASTGKAFTGALMANMFEKDERYTLDTPVRDILGEDFEVFDGYRRNRINTRDLLAHRTGIPTAELPWMMDAIKSREDMLYRARFLNPVMGFREDLLYSNVWYVMAGLVAEQLTPADNRTFNDIMYEDMFQMLNMTSSQYMPEMTEETWERTATPYFRQYIGGELKEVDWEAYSGGQMNSPAGGIMSTANDLVNWIVMVTKEGVNLNDEVVVSETAFEESTSPANKAWPQRRENFKPYRPVSFISEDNYALGWNTGYYRGFRSLAHAGGMWGFWARQVVLPDADMGLFMVTNGPNGGESGRAFSKIAMYALDVMLGEDPWVNATTPVSELSETHVEPCEEQLNEQWRQLIEEMGEERVREIIEIAKQQEAKSTDHSRMKRQEASRAKYAGTYGSYCCENITIVHNEQEDTLSMEYGVGRANLVSADDDNNRFIAVVQDPFWFIPPLGEVFFYSSDGDTMDQLVVPYVLQWDPPIFIRDLTMESQPDMPPDCP